MPFYNCRKMFLLPALLLSSLFVNCLPGTAGATDMGIETDASVTTVTKGLTRKPLYPFHISPGQSLVGIDGYVETVSPSEKFSEALISLHMATSPACPAPGEDIGDYAAINAHFPNITLAAPIVKQNAPDHQRVPVHIRLARPFPLKSCLFLILDGSDFTGKPYTMTAHLHVKTIPTQQPPEQFELTGVLSDEFLMSPQKHETAYKVYHVPKDRMIFSIDGNVAAVAGEGVVFRTPLHWWVVSHSVFLEHGGCPQFPHDGTYSDNPALDAFMFEPQTTTLHTAYLKGEGVSYPNTPFTLQPKDPILVRKGDCLIHGVRAMGADEPAGRPADGINTESQIFMEMTP
ncbi:hypothetical protein EDC15_11917 [Acetobacter aceti NBRC 14818]|uniref:Uncharacterized protein n=1 Tax=Acetobacter aceti NBRC 14818 TaxID=887700 RepID=A0AB33IDB0_ACEAC|nr:hypothetical protein [Acetobacter aceti]TCS30761.1 hypothetical protein EDC15_11917 [Acetobacter aceti NBRC 14818]BCK75921.1 hypothetical protein EMQ_1527 [Acetobacter aceti NBRC 14818]GAN58522.1 hypothetical protein Abac_055_044 [Acetobacter aceti NBRC 14818]